MNKENNSVLDSEFIDFKVFKATTLSSPVSNAR